MRALIFAWLILSCLNLTRAAGINWPANQLLPTFSPPAATIDCIDVSSSTAAEIDLFASLQGIVNRTQPRIACVSSTDGEGKFTWLNLHNLTYNLVSGYSAITKYRSSVNGLVVTDPNQPDTLNLATTIAGVSNLLICDPILLPTLTNAPYNLAIGEDLRGRFADKFQIYNYLYNTYWPQCTHRICSGLYTDLHGNLRDYLVAVKAACVWLDPGNGTEAAALAPFMNGMTANKSIYLGWWPSEANGLNWIAQYGIPVLASDWYRNGSLFSGVTTPINVPEIPPPPPLENKVYVALILSDGDNIQYMQHVLKMRWNTAARGAIPLGWTVTPMAAEMDPMLFNHFWSTATTNDCLVSGPSGAGYTHMQQWSAANMAGFAKISDPYLQRAGLRIITVWDDVTTGVAQAFATNCPSLLGLTDQNENNGTRVDLGLRTILLTVGYSSDVSYFTNKIISAASGWNGTAPIFIAAQADTWNLQPSDMVTVANALVASDPNKYKIVRPDHLFMLCNQIYGKPQAMTESPGRITSTNAVLRGAATPNANNCTAWLEWGTNINYGTKTSVTNVGSGATTKTISAVISGLLPQRIYHYRVVASNTLGMAWGADKQFTTGGRLKTWGNATFGETNIPAGMTNLVAISAGANHGLGLKNDGTVVAWGNNTYGQTNVPAGLSNVVAVAGGTQHSLALLADGTVAAWGDNTYGQTNIPMGLNNVIAIAAGGYHNLALMADQTVVAWGQNVYGQTNMPVGLSNVVDVAAGQFHSLALKADGTVTAWGYNNLGQTNLPVGLNNVVAVSAGQSHTIALKADGISVQNLFPACKWTADFLNGSDGSSISNWTDVAGGKVATQISVGNQPTLYSNVINGHKVVRFASAASQYLSVSAAASPISGAADFTLATVFKTSTPGDAFDSFYENTGLLGCEQPNAVADWALGLNGSQLAGGLGAGAAGCGSDVSLYGGNVTDGKWHVALYVRTGNTIRLYVDGMIVAAQDGLCTAARGSYNFQIGAMTTGTHFFNGDLAEIQLFNRALSPLEISSINKILANTYGMSGVAGTPVSKWTADSLSGSDGSTIGTWTDVFGGKNATQPTTGNRPKLYSNAMNDHKVVRFASPSNQYLTVATNDNPISAAGSFTLLMVFKTSSAGNVSSLFYQNTGLLGCEQPFAVADWALCLNGSQLGFGLGAGASGCGSDISFYGGNVADGNPHIAMCVRAGDTISLYVDGVRVASQNSLCSGARGDYAFQIGAMTSTSYFFNGDIAEIQIYNRALNTWEITSANENLAATYGVGGAAGNVVVWGSTANGIANVPKNFTTASAVAAGRTFNFAVNANGTATGWGYNGQGQTNLPIGLTNVAAIVGGATFGLAIGNQPPVSSNATVSGYVDHDLALTLPAANPDGSALNYRILSLPSSGSLYQSVGGVRGSSISVPNTLVSDSGGKIIFLPAAGATGNPYTTFNFMADDGVFSSSPASVAMNIGLPTAPQFIGLMENSGGPGGAGFELNFLGATNATYSVWAGTNLLSWIKLGTANEASPGNYEFMDMAATNWSQRFYRASAP